MGTINPNSLNMLEQALSVVHTEKFRDENISANLSGKNSSGLSDILKAQCAYMQNSLPQILDYYSMDSDADLKEVLINDRRYFSTLGDNLLQQNEDLIKSFLAFDKGSSVQTSSSQKELNADTLQNFMQNLNARL